MSTNKPPVLVVLGATGAGKSQLALELAQKFGGEVISADAMQMYKGLDIVTNKVSQEERSLVKHHMIDFLDPLSIHTVVDFRNMAVPIVDDLLSRNVIPVICGGTNYYIESLLWKVLVENDPSGCNEESQVKRQKLDPTIQDSQEDDNIPTSNLYQRLQEVDPERASEIHRNERRKILRSLQVFDKYKRKHSDILAEQQSQQGGGLLGGPLRYPKVAVLWVQCDQEVLDQRCNKRVDKMIEQGMVNELEQFHKDFNSKRSEPDYTVGIFQSIGFKEFHQYLILDDDEKGSEKGKRLYEAGVEQLKLVTRQYSRKQLKWIRMRFLNPKRACPNVYGFDSTYPEKWQETAYEPAVKVVEAIIAGETPSQEPLALISEDLFGYEEKRKVFHCDVCDRDMKGSIQFEIHLKSRKHQLVVKRNIDAKTSKKREETLKPEQPEELQKISSEIKE